MENQKNNAYEMTVSEDGVSVHVAVDTNRVSIKDAAFALAAEAQEEGLAAMPKVQRIIELLNKADPVNGVIQEFEICRGTPPVPGQDGWIKWARDFFNKEFIKDEFGRVNHRRRKGNPAVYEGEWLASLFPPKAGKDGVDVFGKSVPADTPKVATLKAGSDIQTQIQDDGTHFYAVKDGRIRYGNGTVDIDEEYIVDSDVCAKTGDVCHPGSVIVHGDVGIGSNLKAEGDLEVHGTIEQADIEVGGSLWVKEGISRTGKKPIKVGGRVIARHLRDTAIEAGEDVEVANEIVNGTILTRGHVDVSNGRCAGAEITALKGASFKDLGSQNQKITTIKVAVAPFLKERSRPFEEKMAEKQKQIDEIHERAGPQLKNQRLLSPKQREAVTELLAAVSDLQMEIEEAQEEIRLLTEESENRARQSKTSILRAVYPGVYIQLGKFHHKLRVSEQLTGPLILVEMYDREIQESRPVLVHKR